ncbi:MAG TPA: sulfate ABC transporter permease subunit CysT [Chloroflexota bacterium]|nr:sulfate ABC transporter permease subunit CysT [Chloroflexota bacterium]HUM68431.1 sulfate ABC transporter permease subunit CysT [Chloroflexota bacterium]
MATFPAAADDNIEPTMASKARIPWGRLGIRAMALSYLFVMLIIPVSVIFWDGLSEGIVTMWQEVSKPIAWSALKLTLWTSALMALINGVMGLLTAFVIVRYTFPGKTTLNAIIDLPLAIPTLVTGLMLVALYGPQQVVGAWVLEQFGQRIIFAAPGIVLALLFVTFPFVVRSVQPVLLGLDQTQEDAAVTLGAGSWTIFRRITLPAVRLPLLSGMLLSFARAIGEFGSIVIVAGNIPFRTQTAAVYVFGEVESENRLGASAVSVVMMAISFGLVALVGWLERRAHKKESG